MEIIKLLCKFSIALSLCVSLQDQSILNWRPQKSFINHSAKKHTQISSIASYFIQHYACMHCASYATQRGSVVFNCMMNITSNYWGIKNNLLFLIVVMKSISWAAGEEIESRRFFRVQSGIETVPLNHSTNINLCKCECRHSSFYIR